MPLKCFSSHLYRVCPQDLLTLCTYRQVACRNVRRNYSLTHIHTHTHIFTYMNEMKSTLPHWNLIGRSMTAPPPVLSPTSILPPPSSHCVFIFSSKDLTRSKFVFNFLLLFKNCVLHIVSRGVSVILQQSANNLVDCGFFIPVACRCDYYIIKCKSPATNAVT
jgi:hypothetical protein